LIQSRCPAQNEGEIADFGNRASLSVYYQKPLKFVVYIQVSYEQ
jgi:hypothetical protein